MQSMAQFQAYDPRVLVNGQTVLSVVAGMGAFKETAVRLLDRHAIANPQPNAWYPQQAWLDAFREIAERIGGKTLNRIGRSIPRHAKFPPGIDSVEKALCSLDAAYRLNHRGGEIGHIAFSKTGPSSGIVVGKNPYPCEFDQGLVEAVANQFKPAGSVVRVEHDLTKPCRKKQGESCTYLVSW